MNERKVRTHHLYTTDTIIKKKVGNQQSDRYEMSMLLFHIKNIVLYTVHTSLLSFWNLSGDHFQWCTYSWTKLFPHLFCIWSRLPQSHHCLPVVWNRWSWSGAGKVSQPSATSFATNWRFTLYLPSDNQFSIPHWGSDLQPNTQSNHP